MINLNDYKGVLKIRKAYDFPGYPYRTVLHDVPKAEALYIDVEDMDNVCSVLVSFDYLEKSYRVTAVTHPENVASIAFFKNSLKENGWKEAAEE